MLSGGRSAVPSAATDEDDTMQTGSKSFAVLVSILTAATGAAVVLLLAGALTTMGSREAAANPKFTQETGKACPFCHTKPPELNDQGKAFKANGNKL
jgi:hypothetical protein